MTTAALSESVLVERDGAVAIIAINRPERRNALVRQTKDALRAAVESAAVDQAVRAVVLTGSGGHFCAGQDLAEHASTLGSDPGHAFDTVEEHYAPIVSALATMPKPVIAAVEGVCVGAGLGFALSCDLRVVAANATLSTAFSSIALTCDSGLSYTLPRAVGEARARELILLNEPLTGEQAQQFGLVTRLVPTGAARENAIELARRLAAGPTLAYAQSKALLTEALSSSLDHMLIRESVAQAQAGASADHAAAVAAFLSKKTPVFAGR